jgi:hypothetical protein
MAYAAVNRDRAAVQTSNRQEILGAAHPRLYVLGFLRFVRVGTRIFA